MRPVVIVALRALLILIALGTVAGQAVIVVVASAEIAGSSLVSRGTAYSALGIAAIACLQAALVALWVLLSMVRRGAIFDERAFRWVDVISVAGLVAALLVAALCLHAGEIDDSPGLGGIGLGVAVAGAAFALLMIVMRGLLHTATQFRHELDQVV